MERKTVKGLVLFTAAATVLAVAPASGAMAAPGRRQRTRQEPPKITWGQCESPGLQRRGAECGLLDVPLDYSKPNGKKIQLAVSRIKAQGRREGLPGRHAGQPRRPRRLRPDPVGARASTCPTAPATPTTGSASTRAASAPACPRCRCDPTTSTGRARSTSRGPAALEQTWLTRSKNYAKACGKAGGALLDHMTTIDSAKDME